MVFSLSLPFLIYYLPLLYYKQHSSRQKLHQLGLFRERDPVGYGDRNFFFLKETSVLFLRPFVSLMQPSHIFKDNCVYLSSTDCEINHKSIDYPGAFQVAQW